MDLGLKLLFTLGLAGFASLANADVVLHGGEYPVILYRTGAFVERTVCRGDSVIYKRTTCLAQPRRLEAVELYSHVLGDARKELPTVDRDLRETRVVIEETDLKIDEYFEADPHTPDTTTLQAEIARKERAIVELELEVQGLQEQIGRIKASPRIHTDPDLPAQLVVLERQLAEAKGRRAVAMSELDDLRSRYVAARMGGHTEAGLRVLNNQRATHVARFNQLKAEAQQILDAVVELNQFFAELVEDQNFAFELDSGAPFVGEARKTFDLFERAQEAAGVIRAEMGQDGIEVLVPHRAVIDPRRPIDFRAQMEWVRCNFRIYDTWLTRCTGFSVMETTGDGDRTVWRLPLGFDTAAAPDQPELADFRRDAMRWDASGNWLFTPACNRTVIDRRNLGNGFCEMKVRYVED